MKIEMETVRIRELEPHEIPLLERFLYEAIFQKPGEVRLPREIIKEPEIYTYIKDFGRPTDSCLVAERTGKVVGAVWTRILWDGVKGFGNIDEHTPEFAISVLESERGKGVGTVLMRRMLQHLGAQGYRRCSLSVQKDNYAVHLYKRLGFVVLEERCDDYIMVCDLTVS